MTEGQLFKLMNAGSIPVYVYIDNVLVYIDNVLVYTAIYVSSLSKDLNIAKTNLFLHIKEGTKLFNKYSISRQGPNNATLISILSTEDLFRVIEITRNSILYKRGFSIIIINLNDNKKLIFKFPSMKLLDSFH